MTSNPSSPSLRPKPLDALVAAAVIALTVVTALLFYAPKTGAGQLTAVITQHGQTVRTRAPHAALIRSWSSRWTTAIITSPSMWTALACMSPTPTVRGRTASTPGLSPGRDSPSCACRRRWSSRWWAPRPTWTRCWVRRCAMKLNARSIALCAVLTALALGLSTLENLFPVTLIVPLPGVKLGLANIVTVFALYELGAVPALTILAARCLLGGLFAGNLSALLFSLLGGFTAMLVMIALQALQGTVHLRRVHRRRGGPQPRPDGRRLHHTGQYHGAGLPAVPAGSIPADRHAHRLRGRSVVPRHAQYPPIPLRRSTLWTRKTRSFSSSWT